MLTAHESVMKVFEPPRKWTDKDVKSDLKGTQDEEGSSKSVFFRLIPDAI